MKNFALWSALLALTLFAGCGGGKAELKEGDPVIERMDYAQTEMPDHLLVCGYTALADAPLPLTTYLEPSPPALSLYDFVHDEAQMRTWMKDSPGKRAYQFRSLKAGSKSEAIGRAVSEPCFGNGDQAREVIYQVVVHQAVGADASSALHALLRAGRTTHFIVDREGHIYQTLDPVHAAFAPTANTQSAIYVALVAPPSSARVLAEALSAFAASGSVGLSPKLSAPPEPGSAQHLDLTEAAYASCQVRGQEHRSATYSEAQMRSLKDLVGLLQREFPHIESQLAVDGSGKLERQTIKDADRVVGILADYQVDPASHEPACLELEGFFE